MGVPAKTIAGYEQFHTFNKFCVNKIVLQKGGFGYQNVRRG
jgi:hypothetical protein